MKKFVVFYSNDVESSKVKEFDTLNEAVAYCEEQTKGEELANGDFKMFKYEVYDTEAQTEDGNIFELDPVYKTPYYWEK